MAANRGGGEDNITAVAFRISPDAAPNLEDTVSMPALTEVEPDERTREYAEGGQHGDTMVVPPGELDAEPVQAQASNNLLQASVEPVGNPRRVRVVLIAIVLLAVVAALIVWGLVR